MPTIFAMGGGGFTMEPGNPALDDYVRSLAPAREPRICLLPTAGGDSEDQIRRFHVAFGDQLCEPSTSRCSGSGRGPVPLREHLLAQDVIYVGGGSMVNLLALWRAHGLDEILREAWQAGIVLAGLSAGSMCWFECGVTKSVGRPTVARGLGFLPGSNSVHYDGEPERRPFYLEAVADGDAPAGWGVDDGAGLLFRGTRLAEVVASRPGARAYRVHAVDGAAVEEAIEPRLLKARRTPTRARRSRSRRCARCSAARRGWRRECELSAAGVIGSAVERGLGWPPVNAARVGARGGRAALTAIYAVNAGHAADSRRRPAFTGRNPDPPLQCPPFSGARPSRTVEPARRARRAQAAAGDALAARRRALARLRRDQAGEEGARGGLRLGRDLLGRARGDQVAALLAALRAHVEQPVGGLDHVEVVLDHDDGVALVDEPLQHLEQLLDVGEVQAGRRLVEDVERPPGRDLAELATRA